MLGCLNAEINISIARCNLILALVVVVKVSLNRNHNKAAFTSEIIAAKYNGVAKVNQHNTLLSESKPPIKGPTINPTETKNKIRPILRALSSGVLRSTMAAWAIDWLPAVKPAMTRPNISKAKL